MKDKYFIVILYKGSFYTDEDFDSFEEACEWAHHHITETIPILYKQNPLEYSFECLFSEKEKEERYPSLY